MSKITGYDKEDFILESLEEGISMERIAKMVNLTEEEIFQRIWKLAISQQAELERIDTLINNAKAVISADKYIGDRRKGRKPSRGFNVTKHTV